MCHDTVKIVINFTERVLKVVAHAVGVFDKGWLI